jgi:hypothetical protein
MMSSRTWIAVVLASVATVGCHDTVSPEAPEPTTYVYDVALSGDLAQSFVGVTQVITIANGHSEPWPHQNGAMVGTDRTWLALESENQSVRVGIALLGPFGTGTFGLRPKNERLDPTARTFEAVLSVETSPGEFRHYKINAGSVVVSRAFNFRRTLSFTFSADTAEVISSAGRTTASLPVQLSGSVTEVPKN